MTPPENRFSQQRVVCPTCGLSLEPNALLCPKDGTPVAAAEPTLISQNPLLKKADPGTWERTAIRDLMVGRKLGDYEVRRRIGNGGMGIVYEGVQPEIGRRVAIKILRPDLAPSSAAMRGLLEEAKSANAIRHRGIIDIYTFGQIEGIGQYLVMEYLDGEPLDATLQRRGRLPEAEVVVILDEVLAAVSAAHSVRVIHRDLKPSNIFLVKETGGGEYVKVLDFGLAKNQATSTKNTQASQVVGTPQYMAPEQAMGEPVSAQTDLYAVGCVAFELLTGEPLYSGETAMAVAVKQVNEAPRHPRELVPELSASMDDFVMGLLAKKPTDRPVSADAARRELRRVGEEPASARTVPDLRPKLRPSGNAPASAAAATSPELPARALSDTTPTPKLGARGPLLWVAAASALVAAVAGTGIYWDAAKRRASEREFVHDGDAEGFRPSERPRPPVPGAPVVPGPVAVAPVEAPPPKPAPAVVAEPPPVVVAAPPLPSRPRPSRLKAEETGQLWVVVSPHRAELWVDGKSYGDTKAARPTLSAGAHVVELRTALSGGGQVVSRPFRIRVNVKPDEVTRINVGSKFVDGQLMFERK